MFCPVCGKPIQPSASFCQSCGAVIPHASALPTPARTKKSPALKFILLGCGVLILLGGGVAVAIFLGVRYAFKTSEAAQAAVLALKQSNSARQALGEITDIGTPMGSISSQAGGSGEASLTASVTGTKSSGRYYATLIRRNGQWLVVSGRIELSDGRSVAMEPQGASVPIDVPMSAGLQLNNEPVRTTLWALAEWPQQHTILRLPPDWIQRHADSRGIEYRVGEAYSSTYLIGNAWVWERDLPAANLVAADAQAASEKLSNGVIAGYEVREVSGVPGVLTISDVGDRRTATWNAIVRINGAQTSIDITLGAQNRDFQKLSPTFNAIYNSIRFNHESTSTSL